MLWCCCGAAAPIIARLQWEAVPTTTGSGLYAPASLLNTFQPVDPEVVQFSSGAVIQLSAQIRHEYSPAFGAVPDRYYSESLAVMFNGIPQATYASATIELPFSWVRFGTSPKPTHDYIIRVHQQTFLASGGTVVIDPNQAIDYSDPGIAFDVPSIIPEYTGASNELTVVTPNIASLINPVLPADTQRVVVLLFQPTGPRTLTQSGTLTSSRYRIGKDGGFFPQMTLTT